MTDRRRRTAASDSTSREENPFAPPPEGQPDQPWQPRAPHWGAASQGPDGQGGQGGHGSQGGHGKGPRRAGADQRGPGRAPEAGGSGDGDGNGRDEGHGTGDSAGGGAPDKKTEPPVWGSQWSSRQPGRQDGGGGWQGGGRQPGGPSGPGGPAGPGGPGGPGQPGGGPGGPRGMRWDPTDPLQRHARYSLHAGIWGLFFALLSVPEVALLLGALSLYWGINALRGKQPKSAASADRSKGGKRHRGVTATAEDVAGTDRSPEHRQETAGRPPIPLAVTPAQAAKAKRTAATSGLVAAGLTLVIVASTYAFQFTYSDYFACQNDALTQSSRDDCKRHLPEELRPFLGNR
ncbi:hypothetical protein ACWV95_23400 [Streptomyces albus]